MMPQFLSEHVVLDVNPTHFSVHGTYVFASDRPCGIVYPFVLAPPDSIWMQGSGSAGSWIVPAEDGAHVSLGFANADVCTLQVHYVQRVEGSHAAYLLRTAQLWDQPIGHVELEILFPESLGIPAFSYPFARCDDGRWRFSATKWVPERDLTVDW